MFEKLIVASYIVGKGRERDLHYYRSWVGLQKVQNGPLRWTGTNAFYDDPFEKVYYGRSPSGSYFFMMRTTRSDQLDASVAERNTRMMFTCRKNV